MPIATQPGMVTVGGKVLNLLLCLRPRYQLRPRIQAAKPRKWFGAEGDKVPISVSGAVSVSGCFRRPEEAW
jgi:hypothetical protein